MEFCDTVMEKSLKSHGILSWQFHGNPVRITNRVEYVCGKNYVEVSLCVSYLKSEMFHSSKCISDLFVYFDGQNLHTLQVICSLYIM